MHERRDEVTSVRLSKSEKRRLKEKADADGYEHNFGGWIRMRCGLESDKDSLVDRVAELETQLQELRKG